MLYFAYSPELDHVSYHRWARGQGLPWSDWQYLGPAMLRDFDLEFARYNESAGGGRATARHALGKRTAGAIYRVEPAEAPHLDRFAGVFPDTTLGRCRQKGSAMRRNDGTQFDIFTYVDRADAGQYAPPSHAYLKELMEFATRLGHGHGWLMHLMTVPTADRRSEPILYDI